MKQNEIFYDDKLDELSIVFEEVEVPIVKRLDNGVSFEFNDDRLSAIILPNFNRMINSRVIFTDFELKDIIRHGDCVVIIIDVNHGERNINVKLNIDSLY